MFTARQRSFGRVCHLCSLGVGVSHVTNTHDALDLTIQGTPDPARPAAPRTWDLIVQGPATPRCDLTIQGHLLHTQVCAVWQAGGLHPTAMLSYML